MLRKNFPHRQKQKREGALKRLRVVAGDLSTIQKPTDLQARRKTRVAQEISSLEKKLGVSNGNG